MERTLRIGTYLAVVSFLLAGIPHAQAEDPTCAPTTAGTGRCQFQSGDAFGTYVYDEIIIPSGVSITATGPLVLQARLLIRVDGVVLGIDATLPGAPAHSIRLASGGDVLVGGTVKAGRGADAENQNAMVASSATGNPGGAGGAVYVSTGPLGVFTLAPGAIIESGDGGNGGYVRMVHDGTSPPSTTLDAKGGMGGAGGTISLDAITATLQGRIELGNGGNGGFGSAVATPESPAAHPGGIVTTAGGDGGPSGTANLPLGMTPFTLYDLGILGGGRGGDGGDGHSYPYAQPLPLAGGTGSMDHVEHHGAACKGTDATGHGEMGGQGCQGSFADARGGKGGPGYTEGGEGGSAYALGGTGGIGGKGGIGAMTSCLYTGDWGQHCPNQFGGPGGKGGWGGPARAIGGEGGDGLILGGKGGDAAARGGPGGKGGKGGQGGWATVLNWGGSWGENAARAIGCYWVSKFNGWAGVVCAITPLPSYTCANGGYRGPGGQSVWGQAIAGSGGRNSATLRGPSGDADELNNWGGPDGEFGDDPVWWYKEDAGAPIMDRCAWFNTQY